MYSEAADESKGKMIAGKENTELLTDLLRSHIAPQSKQAVRKARKEFKEIRGTAYPFSEEQLFARLPQEEAQADPA